jgi:hypothetical protein
MRQGGGPAGTYPFVDLLVIINARRPPVPRHASSTRPGGGAGEPVGQPAQGVDPLHDLLAHRMGTGHRQRRRPGRHQAPHMLAGGGAGGGDPAPAGRCHLGQRPAHRGVRGDRPYSSACARNPSTSRMSRAPAPIEVATSTSTRPRSCTGKKSGLASAAESCPVRPVGSASIRSGTAPAIATTPTPSAETRRSRLHAVKSYT